MSISIDALDDFVYAWLPAYHAMPCHDMLCYLILFGLKSCLICFYRK